MRPLALSADGTRLFAVNTPDARLEILAVDDDGLRPLTSVAVGLEPVAVAVRNDREVWVVNHLSDSISIVRLDPPRVVRTLLVGDEPQDIVFAGPERRRAFVATAHRGQNSPVDPQPFTPGVGRADVWVFDADALGPSLHGDPETIVTLFGDSPRALAATADGRTVYAAVFLSGNRTTTVPEEAVCDGGAEAPPCEVDGLGMPGGVPAPNADADGVAGPETGVIARFDPASGAWADELGRDWRNAVRFELPDLDVFAIDAFADPPVERAAYPGVGTVLYGLAVDPISGDVWVANTEARNDVRLESRLRGRQHESRLTRISEGRVLPRRLNGHLDSDEPLPRDAEASLALPVAVAVGADGETVYVAALGSNRIAALSAAALRDEEFVPAATAGVTLAGGGPTGLVLDEPRGRLYVATRFDNGVSSIDLESWSERQRVAFFDAEPALVRRGRRFLYDAVETSSNGEATCASCHVFGDFDGLAWDLGDPDGRVEINPLPLLNAQGREDDKDFHPLKGPMTTQTLHGLATHGAMHWRGDRNGLPGEPRDERASFRRFNAAFVSLLGREAPLDAARLEALTEFVLAITPPPNPFRPLDGSLTAEQEQGREAFFQAGCVECHALDQARGHFGTASSAAINAVAPQFMKVPHLRNIYRKIGRFFGILFRPLADTDHFGPQIRGFGYSHDGSAGRPADPADAFLIAFDTNLAPVVGQQVTVDPGVDGSHQRARLLAARALAGDCDLVVRGPADGVERAWLLAADGAYRPDRAGDVGLSAEALLATAGLTWTCVPPGSGRRLALDRDGDGALDGDERDAGTDAADPASFPAGPTPTPTSPAGSPSPTTAAEVTPTPAEADGDCDGDGVLSAGDLRRAISLLFGDRLACDARRFDADGDGRIVVAECLAAIARGR